MKRDGRERYDRLDMSVSQSITRNEEDLRKKSQRERIEKEIFIEEGKKKKERMREKKRKNNSKFYGLMEVFSN